MMISLVGLGGCLAIFWLLLFFFGKELQKKPNWKRNPRSILFIIGITATLLIGINCIESIGMKLMQFIQQVF